MQFSNINYNLYKSFLVVYETKNISRAAEILYISQPAVSHNIKELEKQLNIQLFYKKSNGMSATSEAEILYKYISSAFNSIWKGELTISDMAGLKTGVVKVGIPSYLTVLFLSDIITEFRTKYPNIKSVMFGRCAVKNPALFREIRGGEKLKTKELVDFTKVLQERYMELLKSEHYTFLRLKELWMLMILNYEDETKIVKAIRKSKKLEELNGALALLPEIK